MSDNYQERLNKSEAMFNEGTWYTPYPEDWLKMSEWSLQEALLLFAGINPRKNNIEWYPDSANLNHIELLGTEYCTDNHWMCSREQLKDEIKQIRKEAQHKLDEAIKENLPIELLHLNSWMDNDRHVICNRFLTFYDDAEKRLNILIKRWRETMTQVRNDAYSVETFIRWAHEAKITEIIPWWDEFWEIVLTLKEREKIGITQERLPDIEPSSIQSKLLSADTVMTETSLSKEDISEKLEDPIQWAWPQMQRFTGGLSRQTIKRRAELLNIKFYERPSKTGHLPEKGLRESDLRRIINYKKKKKFTQPVTA